MTEPFPFEPPPPPRKSPDWSSWVVILIVVAITFALVALGIYVAYGG